MFKCPSSIVSLCLVLSASAAVAQTPTPPAAEPWPVLQHYSGANPGAGGGAPRAADGTRAACLFARDDGSVEYVIPAPAFTDVAWIQGFNTSSGCEIIGSVLVQWLSPLVNGQAARVFVWDDPDNAGGPGNAVLVAQQDVTVQQVGSLQFVEYALDVPVTVSGVFYVGVSTFIAGINWYVIPFDGDTAYVPGTAWMAYDAPDFDPTFINNPPISLDWAEMPLVLQARGATGEFTYQGHLEHDGAPLNGVADLRFHLYDAATGGNEVGMPDEHAGMSIADGLFSVLLNFGSEAFTAAPRWLEIEVAYPAGGAYTLLTPRQPVTAAPRALVADRVGWGGVVDVPAGFADGVDDGGDGHSLDAADGSPTDVVYVDATGLVGVGTTTPTDKLTVAGVVRSSTGGFELPDGTILDSAADIGTGDITGVTAGSGLTGGGTSGSVTVSANFSGTGAATTVSHSDHYHSALAASDGIPADAVTIDAAGQVGIGTSAPGAPLDVVGLIRAQGLGNAFSSLNPDNANASISLGWYDDASDPNLNIGRLRIGGSGAGSASGVAFQGIGNAEWMRITGGGRLGIGTSAPTGKLHVVDATGGDGSVVLPADAVGAAEILDEPGVASATQLGSASLNGTLQTLLSRSITVPTAGYVLVIATTAASVGHTTGTASAATFGISDDPNALPANQDLEHSWPSAAPTGTYKHSVTVHGLFSVAAGSPTFYFLGQENTGAWSADDIQLTLVYFPTAYGTVTPTLPAGEGGDLMPEVEGNEEVAGRPGWSVPATSGPPGAGAAAAHESESRVGVLERENDDLRARVQALEEQMQRLLSALEQFRAE